jgi:hypothetical protein
MATLIIITHEFDTFLARKQKGGPFTSPYLLFDVIQLLQKMGHTIRIVRGPKAPPGDAAFYHVDATVAPPEYVALASHYPTAINFRTGDISKRKISRLLLDKGHSWDGPVIVKANLNNRAIIEDIHNRRAARLGRPLPHPGVTVGEKYRVLDSLSEVGDEVWSDPALVVEKFIAEPDPDGFALRTWVFMGPRERCTRFVTADRISKAADVLKHEPVEVPDKLRAERERLGFDFGKFDFVMQGGEPVLLDANRTPGIAQAIRPMMKKGALNLAEGLHQLLTGEARPATRSVA